MNQNIFETILRLSDRPKIYNFTVTDYKDTKKFRFTRQKQVIPEAVIDAIKLRNNSESPITLEEKDIYDCEIDKWCPFVFVNGVIHVLSLATTTIYFDGTAVYRVAPPKLWYHKYDVKRMDLDDGSKANLLDTINNLTKCIVCEEKIMFRSKNNGLEPVKPYIKTEDWYNGYCENPIHNACHIHTECEPLIRRCNSRHCGTTLCDNCCSESVTECIRCHKTIYKCIYGHDTEDDDLICEACV